MKKDMRKFREKEKKRKNECAMCWLFVQFLLLPFLVLLLYFWLMLSAYKCVIVFWVEIKNQTFTTHISVLVMGLEYNLRESCANVNVFSHFTNCVICELRAENCKEKLA